MKPLYWLLLIVVQSIWASSYVAMKIMLAHMPYSMVIVMRYGSVALLFLLYWLVKGFPLMNRRIVLGSVLVGFLNFYLSQMFQLRGLEHTQAIDVSMLILFEPMITVFMAYIILKEQISKNLWIVLAVSMLGFFLISDLQWNPSQGTWSSLRLWGNALFLCSLLFEAICSVSGKALTRYNSPLDAMGLLMVFGGVGGLLLHAPTVVSFDYGRLPLKVWLAAAFLSLGCSIFCYTGWYYAISRIRVQYVALSLFLQPVVGTFLGYFILKEQASIKMLVGAGIISLGLLWWQNKRMKIQEKRVASV